MTGRERRGVGGAVRVVVVLLVGELNFEQLKSSHNNSFDDLREFYFSAVDNGFLTPKNSLIYF